MSKPVILIHGYSDRGKSFNRWRKILKKSGYDLSVVHTCNYRTLTNEVTLRDIAEGFDRALREEVKLKPEEQFDVIVHSTGMLVIRAWLAAYAGRRERLNHLIALAPATFGSPLAHKGRSWLGAIFKGEKTPGPDFMEAGNCILDGLELGSKFTWDLAHIDLLGEKQCYGPDTDTPYVFIFCGLKGYSGIKGFFSEKGTDGTVRWAGCALNTRKIMIDLTKRHKDEGTDGAPREPIWATPWSNMAIPLVPVEGLDHGEILQEPSDELIGMVIDALRVSDGAGWNRWLESEPVQEAIGRLVPEKSDQWQQFVVRATDERGDPITDYYLEFGLRSGDSFEKIEAFNSAVHTYSGDKSFRCFHVNLEGLMKLSEENGRRKENGKDERKLRLRIVASSGTQLVGYHGEGSDKLHADGTLNRDGSWDAEIELPEKIPVRNSTDSAETEINPFYPFTTTLVELRLDREPLPLVGRNQVVNFGSKRSQLMTTNRSPTAVARE